MTRAEQRAIAHAVALIYWCRKAGYGSSDYRQRLHEAQKVLRKLVPSEAYQKAMKELPK